MRGTGFISRGGFFGIGQLSVSHGLGGFGCVPYPFVVVAPVEHVLPGKHAPQSCASGRHGPRFIVHIPVAKKK